MTGELNDRFHHNGKKKDERKNKIKNNVHVHTIWWNYDWMVNSNVNILTPEKKNKKQANQLMRSGNYFILF